MDIVIVMVTSNLIATAKRNLIITIIHMINCHLQNHAQIPFCLQKLRKSSHGMPIATVITFMVTLTKDAATVMLGMVEASISGLC
mmetsp:Transcript_14531/g.21590  ORF Transcript_14531/g.21590 Transcript_14531/m.21590 type:complete len:85 (+) Transcript_14531:151-405(+)